MRKLLAALPLAILVACSPAPSTPPAGTPAESAAPAARTGTDITAPASAFPIRQTCVRRPDAREFGWGTTPEEHHHDHDIPERARRDS